MRSINLYYVYDNINEVAITSVIPAVNDLVAAIGFRDSYITNKENKIPYKALDLVRFAQVDVSEDGEYFLNADNVIFDQVVRFQGIEIMDYIKNKMIELGIDDNFIEEEK